MIGAEDFAGKRMWRIVATQPDLSTYCLGSATLSMWVEADNPWASRQTVDVRLSSDNAGQQGLFNPLCNNSVMRSSPTESSV